MLVDLHAKSSATPGVRANASSVVARAKAAGLDAIAFCETLSTATCRRGLDAAAEAGMPAFVGVEIPTDKGILLGFAPEIGDFYLNEEWRQLTEFTTAPASEVVAMFDKIGGAVLAARPYDLSIPYNMGDLIFTLGAIHGVEVFNPRCGQVQCDFALEAARFMGLATCGGSDSPDGEKGLGRYATFFARDLATQADLVEALRGSEFWAVQFGHTPAPKKREESEARSDRGDRGGDRGGRGGDRGRGGRDGGRGGDRGRGGRGGRDGGRGGRGRR